MNNLNLLQGNTAMQKLGIIIISNYLRGGPFPNKKRKQLKQNGKTNDLILSWVAFQKPQRMIMIIFMKY